MGILVSDRFKKEYANYPTLKEVSTTAMNRRTYALSNAVLQERNVKKTHHMRLCSNHKSIEYSSKPHILRHPPPLASILETPTVATNRAQDPCGSLRP